MSARRATSSRRRPGTRRLRPYKDRPARAGVSLARREARNWRISSAVFTWKRYAWLVEAWEALAVPPNSCAFLAALFCCSIAATLENENDPTKGEPMLAAIFAGPR